MVQLDYTRELECDHLKDHTIAKTGPVLRRKVVIVRVLGFLLALLVLVSIGGAVFLAYWDIPAPTSTVEKVLPNERFQN